MNGFLLIDKESGLNSFKLVLALRRIANQKRVGFAGTLDPLASGLMILALGEYTKLLSYLEARDKVYEVVVELGKTSDSFDADGEIVDRNLLNLPGFKPPAQEEISAVLREKFTGKIIQIPPRFSAIQIEGKRAYKMAREGQSFEMKGRPVEIFSTEILQYNFPRLKLRVHCSSGTYIRSLSNDLGEELGCGGMVTELRRTAVGGIKVEKAVALKDLSSENLSANLTGPREIFAGRDSLDLNEEDYRVLARGNFIDNRLPLTGESLAFLDGQVVGVVETTLQGSKLKFRKKLNIF
jgi:tRNA pseudouridine55 synthase